MAGDADKRFRLVVEKLRLVILMAPGLRDRERCLALLMVERIHRKTWDDAEQLVSWLSVGILSAVSGYSTRYVKSIRLALKQKGVIFVAKDGGRGRHNTTVYGFNGEWLFATWRKLIETGRLGAWDGKRYGNGQGARVNPAFTLSDDDVPARSDAKGERPVHRGVNAQFTLKGERPVHPNPLIENPLNEPVPSSFHSDGRPSLRSTVDVPSSLHSDGPSSLRSGGRRATLRVIGKKS
ncbi:MAG TPA: hypothetical protein VIQ53_26715 [Inquilinus sp.]